MEISTKVEAKKSMNISLMTFNVLNAWQPNTPVYKMLRERSRGAATAVLGALPDILCLQELDYYYRHDGELIGLISERYSEADTRDEINGEPWNCIFYRKDRLKPVASGGFNFSANGFEVVSTDNRSREEYPHRACNGSRYRYPEGSAERAAGLERSRFRSLGWAVLEADGGKRIAVATTHYSLRPWCHGEEVSFVCERLSELKRAYGCPVVICGDFNSTTEWGATGLMLAAGYYDAYDLTADRDDLNSCHPTSGKGERETDAEPSVGYKSGAIDHVLLDTPSEVSFYRILKNRELLSVSDHCPSLVEFKL